MDNIQQTLDDLLGYLKGIWIKKRFIIVCTWLVCPVAWLYVANMQDVYQSSAKVYADTRSILQPLLRGLALQTNIDQELQLMAKTLLSRPNLEKIARNTDLDITTTNEVQYEALINMLKRGISFNSSGRENIYRINFKHRDPDVAKRVVEETLTLFVESTLGSNRKDSDTANKFLDSQISEYERRLAAAEIRLSDFKRKHNDVLVESSGGVYGQLSNLKRQLEANELKVQETESRLAQLTGAVQQAKDSLGGSGSNNKIETQYDKRIDTLNRQLDELLIRYTERHPDVIETRSMLRSLKDMRAQEIESYQNALLTGGDDSVNVQGRVGEEMAIAAQNLKNELASLQVRQDAYLEKIESLESKMDLIPQIEAEMTGLNRDYNVTRSKYNDLLRRREAMLISQQADLQSDDVQFRVIDPPSKARKPSGPNRLFFNVVILIAGFGSGIALAFLVSQIQPIVVRPSQLTRATGFPVFGAISHVSVKQLKQVENKKLIIFWVSNSLILIGFAGFMLLDAMGYRLDSEFISKLFSVATEQVRSIF